MEKAIISFFKGGSAVAYVLLLCLVLSLPVVFIYQAFQPPEFTFEAVAVEEDFTGDEIITKDSEKWQKLQLSLSASSGEFSPYSFEIREFAVEGTDKEHIVILDDTVVCTKDESDPFTLTLYVQDTRDAGEIMKEISFVASDYTKSFGEFDLKFEDGKAKPFSR